MQYIRKAGGVLVSEVQTERVLVVPTELFHRLGHFQGFNADVASYFQELLRPAHTSYRPRHLVEKDPSFKQLIPYMIFRHTDASGRQTVFQYTRGKGQGEGRLHLKRSVGIGGHISAIDADGNGNNNPYEEGRRRELEEEVAVDTPYSIRCVGLINDDETEVGRVHLGVVHLLEVEQPNVHPRETEIVESGFQPIDAILADMSSFETWSQICMKALFGSEMFGSEK
jgi:predicted NUDIX family phosphoesterase